jgi:hypothetical protein
MTIRKCPACAQLIHFDRGVRVEACWNCGHVTVLSSLESTGESTAQKLKRILQSAAELDFGPPFYSRRTRAAFLLAIPVAMTMLLICNSFNISVVRDPAAPFASDRIRTEPEEEWILSP